MPIWAMVVTIVGGFAIYFFTFIALGSWSDEVLKRIGSYDDMVSFWIGIFWPITIPVFIVWYLNKLHHYQEG